MITKNSTYEDVVRNFAEKLDKYTKSTEANIFVCISYDIQYIKQMITMISQIFNKKYKEVDEDIANILDELENNR